MTSRESRGRTCRPSSCRNRASNSPPDAGWFLDSHHLTIIVDREQTDFFRSSATADPAVRQPAKSRKDSLFSMRIEKGEHFSVLEGLGGAHQTPHRLVPSARIRPHFRKKIDRRRRIHFPGRRSRASKAGHFISLGRHNVSVFLSYMELLCLLQACRFITPHQNTVSTVFTSEP